ncbi:3-hydroxybenzoate 4-monooxygenase [Pseudoclavibacter triregionum]|nr:3-hydroxybenzoate 4-monooxygenase [Pseudoclavibacter triregionum]
MQFHHHGYVSIDPRVQPAAGVGVDRPAEIPSEIDVLIVGAGPAGMITAAQLSMYPDVVTRIVDLRDGRLEIGRADGLQARSLETFNAFGFAGRVSDEAYHLEVMNFWSIDPDNPEHIIRTARTEDDPIGVSEFPHVIMNQARVIDYFAEFMKWAPTRMEPDYGIEFVSLERTDEGEYPITVTLRKREQAGSTIDSAWVDERDAGGGAGQDFTVKCKYVVGADGARSGVRKAIGGKLEGQQANHAWGVVDCTAVTDFPDIRTKCAITSKHGSILLIPREGGHLFRIYVDLGEVPEGSQGEVRRTTVEQAVEQARRILSPYTLEVKEVAWYSVYEVGHRLTDKFDDIPEDGSDTREPRIFVMGDACHTHSAKAGQGMNVSMQDGFNLGWKLGQVVDGLAPESLLDTYSAERQPAAQNLIDFDKEWSSAMAKKPEDFEDPTELGRLYMERQEFASGFLTDYDESIIVGPETHQELATGFPIGRRFKSEKAVRISDDTNQHIGHLHRADGRWRIYVFADQAKPGEAGKVADWAEWWGSAESPRQKYRKAGRDEASLFDVKVIYRQDFTEFDVSMAPAAFRPKVGKYDLLDLEGIFGTGRGNDIFAARGIADEGCIVVVRPDQYVAHVLPLDATEELGEFFAGCMTAPSA